MRQTAVEWLANRIIELEERFRLKEININDFIEEKDLLIDQALEMEKEQMHKCASFWRGKENAIEKPIFEQYYNETFKSE